MSSKYFDMLPESGSYEFLRSPEESKALVICLHGYSATPYEVKDLGRHLYELGFSAVCPLLPGHGIKDIAQAKKEFAAITTEQLLDFVINLVDQYRQEYNAIILHGQSMGGIISLALAGQHQVDGVLITAAPLIMPRALRLPAAILGRLNLVIKMNKPPLEQGWSYPFMATKPMRSLYQMMKMANQGLANIRAPLMLCYSHNDPYAAKTGEYLEGNLPPTAELHWFDESGHVMLLDKAAEQVIGTIGDFCVKYFV